VFVLRRLEGLSYEEICERLGLSRHQVELQLTLAARHLIRRPVSHDVR
jgi:DNA-directed RNA polymerase specialized sigma24 family protein